MSIPQIPAVFLLSFTETYILLCSATLVPQENLSVLQKIYIQTVGETWLCFSSSAVIHSAPNTCVVFISQTQRAWSYSLPARLQSASFSSLHMHVKEDHANNKVRHVNRGWLCIPLDLPRSRLFDTNFPPLEKRRCKHRADGIRKSLKDDHGGKRKM